MTQTESSITEAAPLPQPSLPAPSPTRRVPGLRLALLAALLLWLACSPVGFWPLAWVGIAPLLLSVTRAQRVGQAIWRGYVFGWAYLGAVWYWTGLTIVGWTGSSIGWLAWAGLTTILASFYAGWGGAVWWLARRATGGWQLVAFAAAWVVMEWMRTLGSLTMPWAQLSYTQYHFLPVLQCAEFTGAYGVSFLLMLVNGAVAHGWERRGKGDGARWLWPALTIVTLASLFGILRLIAPETGKPVTVAAMQGNFHVRETRADIPKEMETFASLTRGAYAAIDPPPALYVWSESASPGDAINYSVAREMLRGLARDYNAAVLVGSRIEDPDTFAESNASVLYLPDGSPPLRYNKRQLVPFGEFIPYRSLWPKFLTDAFQFFDTDVTPGDGPTVLRFTDAHNETLALGPFICYESMYPNYARSMTQAGANLLVTQSNDSWFQSRAAMEQHLAAVVLRAIENRRDVVRATTSGITCLLDSKGRTLHELPRDTARFTVGTVRLRDGLTLYARFGDWFVALCAILILAAVRQTETARPKHSSGQAHLDDAGAME